MKHTKILSLFLAVVMTMAALLSLASCSTDTAALPIICGENGMNDSCGIATYGVDYYRLGVKGGDMAADILLDGKKPAEMPVATDPSPALTVNEKIAAEIGFTIPEAVKNAAAGKQEAAKESAPDAIVKENGDFTVGILQLLPHVALDQANEGFQNQLSVRMKAAGKTVVILNQNASGEPSNNSTIANDFVSKKVDLIYTIATSSSQAAATAAKGSEIPVVFNAVTDPVDAGLVASMEAPGANVTGVSDINPVGKQIELAADLLGKKEIKIGLLYTAGETNSIFQINLAKAQCEKSGFTFVEKGITDANDIRAAFVSLRAAGVDLIYIPTDNVLASAAANVHLVNTGK